MCIAQCRLKGCMTQIYLNLLQGISFMEQQRCTGVPQIMKTNFLKSVLFDKTAKPSFFSHTHQIVSAAYPANPDHVLPA